MFTRKNIGWVLTGLLAAVLLFSAFGKLSGSEEVKQMFESGGLVGWQTIIGLGELVSLILFILPKTMRLGALLLCGYFGGAIMFHMSNPVLENQAFLGPAVFFVGVIAILTVRDKAFFGI